MLDNHKAKQEIVPKGGTSKKNDKRITAAATTKQVCELSKGNHRLYECKDFLKLSAQERKEEVQKKQMCMNCLRIGHYAKDCRSSNCRKCSRAHNILLHLEKINNNEPDKGETDDSLPKHSETEQSVVVAHCAEVRKTQALANADKRTSNEDWKNNVVLQVILSTARVYIRDRDGNRKTCRALLDPGSQSHFITEELINQLQLPIRKETHAVNGIMQITADIKQGTQIRIESQHTGFKANLDCLVLPRITEKLPQFKINRNLQLSKGSEISRPGI